MTLHLKLTVSHWNVSNPQDCPCPHILCFGQVWWGTYTLAHLLFPQSLDLNQVSYPLYCTQFYFLCLSLAYHNNTQPYTSCPGVCPSQSKYYPICISSHKFYALAASDEANKRLLSWAISCCLGWHSPPLFGPGSLVSFISKPDLAISYFQASSALQILCASPEWWVLSSLACLHHIQLLLLFG